MSRGNREKTYVAFPADEELRTRIDLAAKRVGSKRPGGARISRAEVLRVCVRKQLTKLEETLL